MENILSYWDHIKEAEGNSLGRVYHVGTSEYKLLDDRPMWFALELEHSTDGWFKNTLESSGEAYQYSSLVTGKIAHTDDPKIRYKFGQEGIDLDEWITDIVSNPDADEVMSLEGTDLFINMGYSGVIYPDYDPRDFNRDLDALLVFSPRNSLRDFRLEMKKSTYL